MSDTHYQHFASLSAMSAAVDHPLARQTNKRVSDNFMKQHGRDWYGMAGGFKEVEATIKAANVKDSIKLVENFMAALSAKLPRAEGIRRQIRRGDSGDDIDIHAVNRGNMDRAWTSSRRTVKRGTGLLRIVVDVGGNSITNAERLAWRGVAGAALAGVTSKAGYAVEIVAGFAIRKFKRDGSMLVSTTVIKPYNAAANTALVASTVCLSGYLRTLGFKAIVKAADDDDADADDSLGHAIALDGVLPASPKVAQIVVSARVRDESSARAWIEQNIQLLGGTK